MLILQKLWNLFILAVTTTLPGSFSTEDGVSYFHTVVKILILSSSEYCHAAQRIQIL